MDQIEDRKQSGDQALNVIPAPATVSPASSRSGTSISPQASVGTCVTCGSPLGSSPDVGMTYPYVYALGKLEARFPSLAVEKEYKQVVALYPDETQGKDDDHVRYIVLSKPENRYLARLHCWVLSVEGQDIYIVQPRDARDFDRLVEAIAPPEKPRRFSDEVKDIDVLIGVRGPIAPPEMCNGLSVPIVVFDHMYHFNIDALLDAIPRPETIPADQFEEAAATLFLRIIQMADNAGAMDEHRALNYLAVRYDRIYANAGEALARNTSLVGIEVRPSRLSGTRKIVDVIFSFTNRQTDVTEKHFVRVDVSEEFPFLVGKMSPYYDR